MPAIMDQNPPLAQQQLVRVGIAFYRGHLGLNYEGYLRSEYSSWNSSTRFISDKVIAANLLASSVAG